MRYLKLWWLMTKMVSQVALVSRFGAIIFMFGKILRFLFFLLFLLILISRTDAIAGYSAWQIIFFFLTFNIVDTLAQFFLREVYRFRSYVISGDFDYFLTKPMPPLFRLLFGGSDILDLPILFILVIFLGVALTKIGGINIFGVILYTGLLINAFLIALAFHILVLSIGILTTEVDNTLWLYRDVTSMGRVPIDIYREPLKWIITFIFPVGIMMSFPAKAVFGLLSLELILISVLVSATLFYLSVKLWNTSLKKYSSVSS